MELIKGEKYRLHGCPGSEAIILDTEMGGAYPVLVKYHCQPADDWSTKCFNLEGVSPMGTRLVQASPYDDFKIDDPVMVRDTDRGKWIQRYFAGVTEDGFARVFVNGRTSWSARGAEGRTATWNECRRPTKEELSDVCPNEL